MKLSYKRTRPIHQRRRSKIFRLHPKTLKRLSQLVASGKFRDQTSAIEAAVEKLTFES